MNKEKTSVSTCGDCSDLNRSLCRCVKYRCPLPVNINLEILRCIQCREEWRCNDESKSKIGHVG